MLQKHSRIKAFWQPVSVLVRKPNHLNFLVQHMHTNNYTKMHRRLYILLLSSSFIRGTVMRHRHLHMQFSPQSQRDSANWGASKSSSSHDTVHKPVTAKSPYPLLYGQRYFFHIFLACHKDCFWSFVYFLQFTNNL